MIKKAANYLTTQLKIYDIKIMRYDAYTTNSVYLKLDDGVIGTIRISDHEGKKHLKYKYNLIKNSKRYQRDDNGITRYYLPMRDIDILIQKILYDRKKILKKYGKLNYLKFMQQNVIKGKKNKGFWKQAKYV